MSVTINTQKELGISNKKIRHRDKYTMSVFGNGFVELDDSNVISGLSKRCTRF